jgi:hypothetical protein
MIVTGIVDLEQYEPRGRSTASYIEKSRWLLGSDVPMVVFADARLRPAMELLRPQGSFTLWQEPGEPIPDARIKAGIARSKYRWNPAKDTPRYFALMRMKISWLRRGAETAGGPVTWVDLALPESPIASPAALLRGTPERIRLAEISHVPRCVRHDRASFYADHYWPVAGGVIRGMPEDLIWLDERIEEEWQWCLSSGFAATDEMMLGFVRHQHPHRFETYFADHPTLVDNWNGVRGSHRLIVEMALRAMDDGDTDGAKRRFDAVASCSPS